ncbi:MAG: hypothetical protein JNG84_02370 [Archangium sp.]|nr:hypothetical protein [Archangium sp.]
MVTAWRLAPLVAMLALAACKLDRTTLYRCETDRTCAQAGATCAPDGYCYPEGVAGPKWPEVDAGCVAEITSCDDVGATCGFLETGCQTLFCGSCFDGTECGTERPNTCSLARVCERGFCWESPLPQGNDINDLYAVDERHVWLVTNSSVLFWDGERTSVVPTPLEDGVRWQAISGTGPSNIFVAGTRGRILVFDGQRWASEQAGSTFDTTGFRSVAVTGEGTAVVTRNAEVFGRTTPAPAGQGIWSAFDVVPRDSDLFAAAGDAGVFLVNDRGALWQFKTPVVQLAPEQGGALVRNMVVLGPNIYLLLSYGPDNDRRIRIAHANVEAPGMWGVVYDSDFRENPRRFHTLDGRRFWMVSDGSLDAIDRLDMQAYGQAERSDAFPDSAEQARRRRYTRIAAFPSGRVLATGQRGAMAVWLPDAGTFRSTANVEDVSDTVEALCAGADGWLGAASQGNGLHLQSPLAPGQWDFRPLPDSRSDMTACAIGPGSRRWAFGTASVVATIAQDGATAVPSRIAPGYDFVSAAPSPTSSSLAVLGTSVMGPSVFVSPSGAGEDWEPFAAPAGASSVAWAPSAIYLAGESGLIARLEPDAGWTQLRRSGPRLESIRTVVHDGGVTMLVAAGQRGALVQQRADGGFVAVPAGTDDFADLWPAASGEVFLAGGRSDAPHLTIVLPSGEVMVEPLPLSGAPKAVIGRDLPDGPKVWVGGPGGILRRASPDGG